MLPDCETKPFIVFSIWYKKNWWNLWEWGRGRGGVINFPVCILRFSHLQIRLHGGHLNVIHPTPHKTSDTGSWLESEREIFAEAKGKPVQSTKRRELHFSIAFQAPDAFFALPSRKKFTQNSSNPQTWSWTPTKAQVSCSESLTIKWKALTRKAKNSRSRWRTHSSFLREQGANFESGWQWIRFPMPGIGRACCGGFLSKLTKFQFKSNFAVSGVNSHRPKNHRHNWYEVYLYSSPCSKVVHCLVQMYVRYTHTRIHKAGRVLGRPPLCPPIIIHPFLSLDSHSVYFQRPVRAMTTLTCCALRYSGHRSTHTLTAWVGQVSYVKGLPMPLTRVGLLSGHCQQKPSRSTTTHAIRPRFLKVTPWAMMLQNKQVLIAMIHFMEKRGRGWRWKHTHNPYSPVCDTVPIPSDVHTGKISTTTRYP